MNDLKEKVIPGIMIFILLGIVIVVISFIIDTWPEPESPIAEPVFQIDPMQQGKIYVNNGQLWAAIDSFNIAITEDPTNEMAWHEKGKLLNRIGTCYDAQLHYEKYLDHFPNSLRAHEGLKITIECEPKK